MVVKEAVMRMVRMRIMVVVVLPLGHHQGFGSDLTSTLGAASWLGNRITTCNGLVWVLEAVLAGPAMVALDMGSLAASTRDHRDHDIVE